ncbi:hypothetical protein C8R47DRAFT_982152, partial [Mycena vitilis]
NVNAYIGTQFLLRLVREQGLIPSHLIKIVHTHSGATHIIAIFSDGRYLCDCCMGMNLGVVCRHYFVAWVKIPGLPFHISLIRARWYQDTALDVRQTPTVTLRGHTNRTIQFTAMSLPAALVSNPVSAVPHSATPAPPTTTIGQRVVYTALTAEVRSLMSGIQTQEQLDDIREQLQNVG